MRVNQCSCEIIVPWQFRTNWETEMTSAANHVVKHLSFFSWLAVVSGSDCELLSRFVEGDILDNSLQFNPGRFAVFLEASLKIASHAESWWEGWCCFAPMVHKSVVRELIIFLGSIDEKSLVHSVMDWLAVSINSCFPGIVPEAKVGVLLLVDDNLGDVLTSILGHFKSNVHGESTWASSDHANSFVVSLDRKSVV